MVLGTVATVWDEEVVGMIEGLRRDQRVVLLADSRAAIVAVGKAGRTGKARSSHLKAVVDVIEMRQGTPGGGVILGWVKSHIGIERNGKVNEEAKGVAEEAAGESKFKTGGRIRHWVKEQTNKTGMKEDWPGKRP